MVFLKIALFSFGFVHRHVGDLEGTHPEGSEPSVVHRHVGDLNIYLQNYFLYNTKKRTNGVQNAFIYRVDYLNFGKTR
jgi:hypothetical protein